MTETVERQRRRGEDLAREFIEATSQSEVQGVLLGLPTLTHNGHGAFLSYLGGWFVGFNQKAKYKEDSKLAG